MKSRHITLAATGAAIILAIAGIIAVMAERLILGGTLLLFTSFAIYIRETNK